jgi:hypothetical protein
MVSKVITIYDKPYGFKVKHMAEGHPPGSKSVTVPSRPIILL